MLLSIQQRRYDESYNTHEISEKLKSVNTPDRAVTKLHLNCAQKLIL
jgi:hypothetical protein